MVAVDRDRYIHRLNNCKKRKGEYTCITVSAGGRFTEVTIEQVRLYEGGLKSKFRFVITFLFFIVHT